MREEEKEKEDDKEDGPLLRVCILFSQHVIIDFQE